MNKNYYKPDLNWSAEHKLHRFHIPLNFFLSCLLKSKKVKKSSNILKRNWKLFNLAFNSKMSLKYAKMTIKPIAPSSKFPIIFHWTHC